MHLLCADTEAVEYVLCRDNLFHPPGHYCMFQVMIEMRGCVGCNVDRAMI